MSDDEIKKNLLEAGWKESDFISILSMGLRQKKSLLAIFKDNKILFSAIIFLIIAGIGAAVYMTGFSDEYQEYRNEIFGVEIKYPKNLKMIKADYYKEKKIISLNLEFYNLNSDPNEDDAIITFDINALDDAIKTIQDYNKQVLFNYGGYQTTDIYVGNIKIEGIRTEDLDERGISISWIKDGLSYDIWGENELIAEEFISRIKLTPVKFSQSDFEPSRKLSSAGDYDSRRISDTHQLRLALELYYDANGYYPAGLNLLTPETIRALPKDPVSGNDYIYAYYPANNPDYYHLGAILETYEESLSDDSDCNSLIKGSCSPKDPYVNGFNGDDNGACGVEGAQGFCYDITSE